MTVYLVWDGYEDVVAIFSDEDKARRFVENYVRQGKTAFAENMTINAHEVIE